MVAWTLAIPAAVTLTILPCVFRGIRFRQVREHIFWDSKTLQSRGQGLGVDQDPSLTKPNPTHQGLGL